MYIDSSLYLNRTVCDVLSDMRALDKSKNYSGMSGLIEEVQSMVNRMEAKLNDVKDLERLRSESKKAQAKLRKLKSEIEKLEGEE